MDKNRVYLFSQTGITLGTLVALAALGESRFEVYFSLFTVVHFACSALFRPRRRMFDLTSSSMFLGFCYIVVMKIVEIIG